MLKAALLWILQSLEEAIDSDYKARLDRFRAQKVAIQLQIQRETAEIAKLDQQLNQLATERRSTEAQLQTALDEIEAINHRIEEIRDDAKRNPPTDHDALRATL
jgi:chromosome segregation ATPase